MSNQMNLNDIQNNINEKLFHLKGNLEKQDLSNNQQYVFEQYKLLIDSAHKTEERRGGSNNIFLGINTILASFLVRPSQITSLHFNELPLIALLTLIGMCVCWDWLAVTISYKRLNTINFFLIQAFEKFMPTSIFSLRAETEVKALDEKRSNKTNVILNKEALLPKAFITLYIVYFLTVLYYLFLHS